MRHSIIKESGASHPSTVDREDGEVRRQLKWRSVEENLRPSIHLIQAAEQVARTAVQRLLHELFATDTNLIFAHAHDFANGSFDDAVNITSFSSHIFFTEKRGFKRNGTLNFHNI
jgi:hypothetical protein